MNNLVVIGLDAQFANQATIDRFDRCIYLGDAIHAPFLQSRDVSVVCRKSVDRLLLANGLVSAELAVIVVSANVTDADRATLSAHYPHIHCVPTLPQAMKIAYSIVREKQLAVAVVGINVCRDASVTGTANTVPVTANISFDQFFEGYPVVEGIASMLLSSAGFAFEHKAYVYASIKGYSDFSDIATACAQALNDSSFTVNDVKYLETSALSNAAAAESEMRGLIKGYNTDNTLETAVGGLRAITGEGEGFSQVAGLLKTVIAVYQRYFPGVKNWQEPRHSAWQDSPFYFPTESRPWLPNSNGKPLVAAYSCLTPEDYCHIVLQENQEDRHRSNGFMACSELVLIPLAADSQKALLQALEVLEQSLSPDVNLQSLAQAYYEIHKREPEQYTLTLLAESADELRREIDLAKEGINTAYATNHEWKTPKGSFFTPEPVHQEKNIAFLYPGIGATYIGLGRDIFHLFPEIYAAVADLADDIAASLKDKILNPRALKKLSFNDLKKMDHDLRTSLPDIAECGVGFACVFTKIFEIVFRLKANFSAGYSMGEISMYAALGCWKKPGEMSARLAKSDTFNNRLTGRLETLRQHWGLTDADVGESEKLWETYTLKATPEEVAEACEDEDRVYCTIINTPDSLVIGGYPEACERVIKKLGVRGMALDIQNAIHSAPAFKEYEKMEALYTMDVNDRIETKIYSSSCYLPVPQRTKAIANSISKCLCDPVDYPRLINTVYDNGARVFIEMGPGRSLCSWVDKILKHDEIKPHVSVPVNAKGVSDELTIMRAVAKLVSHGIKLDMNSIFYGSLLRPIHNTASIATAK